MSEKKMTVRAAERALEVLLCFVNQSSLGISEIAKKTQLNKSTVFRLLYTLEQKGFVRRDPASEKFQLGYRIRELANHYHQSDDPAILFLPEMKRLRDFLNETISLYVRDGKDRIRIQAVESYQSIRHVAPVGVRLPLSVGASSKVLMAYMTEEERGALSLEKLQSLDTVFQDGYAMSREEREAGTASISVPILSSQHQFIAALAVSGPVERMQTEKMMEILPHLKQSAERMGQML